MFESVEVVRPGFDETLGFPGRTNPIARGDPCGAEATVERSLLSSIAVGAVTGATLDFATYEISDPAPTVQGALSHAVEGSVTGGLWGAGLGGISALSEAWGLSPLAMVALRVDLGLFMACEALVMAELEDIIQPHPGPVGSDDQAIYIVAASIGTAGASNLPKLAEGLGSQLAGTPADPGFWVGLGDSVCKITHRRRDP